MFQPNSIHVMVDLETMDLTPTSAILSIGAIKFCPMAAPGKMAHESEPYFPYGASSTFYQTVNLADSIKRGFSVSGHTITWWMEQNQDVRANLFTSTNTIDEVLHQFATWYGRNVENVWAGPAGFDIPILEHAFRKLDKLSPWLYSDVRDYSTFRKVAAELLTETVDYVEPRFKHHALHDAVAQMTHLQKLARALHHQKFMAAQ